MDQDASDRVLLRACRRGDEPAARAFHSIMFPLLVGEAKRLLSDRALAEDAAQATLLRVLRTSLLRVDLVRRPRAWLVVLVRREALMLRRSRKRREMRERGAVTPRSMPAAENPEQALLDAAVAALPDSLRDVVVLRHRANLSFDEMGQVSGVSRDTLASRYRRALELLRLNLAESEPHDSPTEQCHAR